jgi:hypothetical protein
MAIPVASSSPGADRVQIELLRRAGTARRLGLARSLSESAISLARAAIRAREPGLAEREILLRFVATHYGRELADAVRRRLDCATA